MLIDTRRAADLLGATPMDRPEDVETNPVNGRVYVMLTNNNTRKPDQISKLHPRPTNLYGHYRRTAAAGNERQRRCARRDCTPPDSSAGKFCCWRAIRPNLSTVPNHPDTEKMGNWLAAPDNCTFDKPRPPVDHHRPGGSSQRNTGIPDGVYACDVNGAGRGLTRFFYAVPKDAEMCGPPFTPDNKTLFVAVQHPGRREKDLTFDNPSTRWRTSTSNAGLACGSGLRCRVSPSGEVLSCLYKKKYPRRRRAHCVARLRWGLSGCSAATGCGTRGLLALVRQFPPFSVASCAARRRRGQEGKPICDQPPTVSIPFGVLCLPVERRATEWGRATVGATFLCFWRPKENARASGAGTQRSKNKPARRVA